MHFTTRIVHSIAYFKAIDLFRWYDDRSKELSNYLPVTDTPSPHPPNNFKSLKLIKDLL